MPQKPEMSVQEKQQYLKKIADTAGLLHDYVTSCLNNSDSPETEKLKQIVNDNISRDGTFRTVLKDDKMALLTETFMLDYKHKDDPTLKDFPLMKKLYPLLNAYGMHMELNSTKIEGVDFSKVFGDNCTLYLRSCEVKNCAFPRLRDSGHDPESLMLISQKNTFENCTFKKELNAEDFYTCSFENCRLELQGVLRQQSPVSGSSLDHERQKAIMTGDTHKAYIIEKFYNGKDPTKADLKECYLDIPGLLGAIREKKINNHKDAYGIVADYIMDRSTNKHISHNALDDIFFKKKKEKDEILQKPGRARQIFTEVLYQLKVGIGGSSIDQAITGQTASKIDNILRQGRTGNYKQTTSNKLTDFAEYLCSLNGYDLDSAIEASLVSKDIKKGKEDKEVSAGDIRGFRNALNSGVMDTKRFISFLEIVQPNSKHFKREEGKYLNKGNKYEHERNTKKLEWTETHQGDDTFMKNLSFSAVFAVKYIQAASKNVLGTIGNIQKFLNELQEKKLINKADLKEFEFSAKSATVCGKKLKNFELSHGQYRKGYRSKGTLSDDIDFEREH